MSWHVIGQMDYIVLGIGTGVSCCRTTRRSRGGDHG
jgi:hypothetical protein